MALTKHRPIEGFTLLELLVTMALLALLAAIAFPSFAQVVQANRVITATNEFKSALSFTRTEALRRNHGVSLVPLGGEWPAGWQSVSDGQTLRRWPRAQEGVTVSGAPAAIRFNSQGRLATSDYAAEQISFGLADQGRCLRLEPSGLARVLAAPHACPN